MAVLQRFTDHTTMYYGVCVCVCVCARVHTCMHAQSADRDDLRIVHAQNPDPSFARTILRLTKYSPTHYFMCGTCMLIEQWRIMRLLSSRQKSPSYQQRRSGANCYHKGWFASNLCTGMHYKLITFSYIAQSSIK